mgnify:CR=1 FL=1
MQNLTTIGPVVLEIICLIKIGTERQTDEQREGQTDRRGRLIFSHSKSHDTSRKHEDDHPIDRSMNNTSLAYARDLGK